MLRYGWGVVGCMDGKKRERKEEGSEVEAEKKATTIIEVISNDFTLVGTSIVLQSSGRFFRNSLCHSLLFASILPKTEEEFPS